MSCIAAAIAAAHQTPPRDLRIIPSQRSVVLSRLPPCEKRMRLLNLAIRVPDSFSSMASYGLPQHRKTREPAVLASARPIASPNALQVTPSNAWCCTARMNETSHSVEVQRVMGYSSAKEQRPFAEFKTRRFDLTTSNDWMEYLELTGHRESIEGGAGAYDTMRCDLVNGSSVNIWGADFHMERLTASYSSLKEQILETSGETHSAVRDSLKEDLSVDQAVKESKKIINVLLMEASNGQALRTGLSNFLLARPSNQAATTDDVVIQLIKLTILWTPLLEDEGLEIIVRGHACTTCSPMYIHTPPVPIVATLAMPVHSGRARGAHPEAQEEQILPSRMHSPQIKVASWCRHRRPLENPHTFKPRGVGEVLMVRSVKGRLGDMEILEGLTSNFCALYKDGSLRTASEGVLYGYARHLVLKCANQCGLNVCFDPILVSDATEGKWESAFITSSSRLIYPIRQILVPLVPTAPGAPVESGDMPFRELWRDESFEDNRTAVGTTPRWSNLLRAVLSQGGYA